MIRAASVCLLLLLLPLKGWGMGVLILGDSLSAGYGLEPGAGWVSLLEARLEGRAQPVQVINASISGETTSGGLTRLPQLLERHRPQLVVIELGANDGLRGTPLAVVERNLDDLVSQAKTAGARVLLLGMRIPPNYGRRYADGFHALFKQVAERHQVAFHPFFMDGVAGDPSLMQVDGLHPNRQAQPALLDNVWSRLELLLTPGKG